MVLELMVARFRASMRPINRVKHVIDYQTAVPVNVQIEQILALVVNNPALANVTECDVGSTINSIFFTTECVASETSTTATPNLYLMVVKNPGGNLVFPNGNAVGANDNKRFVIHQEMIMLNPTDGGNPRNIFKGVVKIPKGYRRMAPNDKISVILFIPSTGVAVNACTQAHYKEFQ